MQTAFFSREPGSRKQIDLELFGTWGQTAMAHAYFVENIILYHALAKISGLKYCEFLNKQYGTDYISVMPTNLYGPNDNYHPTHSHVLPALIRRFHEAKVNGLKEVTCWGDGSPLREFLYVDDLANLCVFLMNNYSGDETVNAGTGKELTIKELTELVAKVIGYEGEIKWDSSKPNGTPRKLLDVSKATNLGWTYKTELEEGIENIIMFIPFGLLAPMVFKRMRKVRFCVFIGFLCSCGIELSQLITQRGYCQLDDVVTNTVGMLVGWGIWKMLSSVGIAKNPLF